VKPLFDTGAIRVPWPTTIDGTEIRGDQSAPKLCTELCKTRECQQRLGTRLGVKCHIGLTYYSANVASHKIVVYGVVGGVDRSALPKYPRLKDDLKGRTALPSQFQAWIEGVEKLQEIGSQQTKEQMSRALHPFHDARNLAGDILELTNKLLNSHSGISSAERFESADENTKALVKAAELLVDTYDLAAIYISPESASFGRKRSLEVYKLVDKLRMILSLPMENRPTRKIRIEGRCFATVDLYDSFKLIPLTLLDNAIKYATKGDVTVRIDETAAAITVEVESVGPEIESQELKEIFEYGKRGRFAKAVDKKGQGLGLYAASVVARANGIRLSAKSTPLQYAVNAIPQAVNRFAFEIPRH
jgi:signal transduction histidine kinase